MKNEQVAAGMVVTAAVFGVAWLWRELKKHSFLPDEQKPEVKTNDNSLPLVARDAIGNIELNVESGQSVSVNVGYDPVQILKMFGPLIFASLRIQANAETCEWVIERLNPSTGEWVEYCRIPGQKEGDFEE